MNALALQSEIVALRRENAVLRRAAFTDPLTGLANRAALERDLVPRWTRGDRGAVILIDLDDFKAVNDTYGHIVGDDVLREFGDVIRGAIRSQDRAARYGGEEFAVLAFGADGEEIAGRIVRAVAARTFARGIRLTASAGVAAVAPPVWDGLLASADDALYRAKMLGKNRVVAGPTQ